MFHVEQIETDIAWVAGLFEGEDSISKDTHDRVRPSLKEHGP